MRKKLLLLNLMLIFILVFCSCGAEKTKEKSLKISQNSTSTSTNASYDAINSEASDTFDTDSDPAYTSQKNASEDSKSNETAVSGSSSEDLTSSKDTGKIEDDVTASIYSYLQGIRSYNKGLEWSGSWSQIEAGGQQFSAFGCGTCCISNIYSTMTGTAHDPNEMYSYAISASSYNPDSGVGAITWDQLQQVLQSLGISCQLLAKPADLGSFAQLMESHKTLLVLVSSYNDDAIWTNVPGHYVNLWDYYSTDGTVFLTDSKGPHNNRRRVSLSDVYNALKTSSEYQIMTCDW